MSVNTSPSTAVDFVVALGSATSRLVFSGEPGAGRSTLVAAALAATAAMTDGRIVEVEQRVSTGERPGGRSVTVAALGVTGCRVTTVHVDGSRRVT